MGKSKVVSLVFLSALGVMMFLWWMNENKEGVLTWVLRTGLAVAVIINIFSAPQLVGLPPICSGSTFN
jgi:membrane protein YdbS with pleckstrin-like domain